MATEAILQYVAVAIIVITAIIVAIRYIYRMAKSNDVTCGGCPLSDCCNKKNSAARHKCPDKNIITKKQSTC